MGPSWSLGTAPAAGDTAVLTAGSINASTLTLTVGRWIQTGGTLSGTGTLTVTGSAQFSGSYDAQTGTGKTLLKGATQVDDSYLTLDGGRTLENAGTLTLQSGTIYLGYDPFATTLGGGTLVNDKGASFLIESDGTNVQVDFGTTGFTNAGLVEKEFSSGVSNIYAAFTNIGTVSVQSGTLSFDGGGSSNGGAFTVAAGATLAFGGGTFTLTGGTYSVVGQTLVSGGTLSLAGGTMTAGEFAQSYGTIAGAQHFDGDRLRTVFRQLRRRDRDRQNPAQGPDPCRQFLFDLGRRPDLGECRHADFAERHDLPRLRSVRHDARRRDLRQRQGRLVPDRERRHQRPGRFGQHRLHQCRADRKRIRVPGRRTSTPP